MFFTSVYHRAHRSGLGRIRRKFTQLEKIEELFFKDRDSNRGKMIKLLAAQLMNLNSITEQFDISRPAVNGEVIKPPFEGLDLPK